MSACFLNHPNTRRQESHFEDLASLRIELRHWIPPAKTVLSECGKFRSWHLPNALSFSVSFKDHPACVRLTYLCDVRNQVAYAFRQVYNFPLSL